MEQSSKSKNADVPEAQQVAPYPDNKKIRLKFGVIPKEAISAIASETLRAGSSVEALPFAPKVGDKTPDGSVFAGISPDTNKPMYATAADASLTMTFKEAQKYADQLDAHGHKDWHVPTRTELNVLFNNRAVIGGFDVSGADPGGWYWSASRYGRILDAWGQFFCTGYESANYEGRHSSVRCVR